MSRKVSVVLFCLAVLGCHASSLRAAGAEFYDKARDEGKLVLYSCPGRQYVEPLVKELERRYPGVTVEATYGKGSQLQEKIRSEARAGRPVADLHSCGWNSVYQFGLEGRLDKYLSPHINSFYSAAVDKSGLTIPHSSHVYGIVINTTMASTEEIRSWADLTNPKWKGKLAIQDPRPGGGGFSWFVQTLTDPALSEAYLRKMAAQKIFFGRTNDLVQSMLVRGEYAIHIAGTEERAGRAENKGAPLQFINPRDGAFFTRVGFGLVKNAPHPNAAKLYIDFVLSETGQKILGQTGYIPLRKGIESSQGADALEGANLALLQTEEGIRREPEFAKKLKEVFFP
ncbi:MAG: ABC transporter substrate-binding protein [Candidatus Binatia bacterium]